MPPGAYVPWLGQLSLYDPEVLPLDLGLRDFVHAYRAFGPDKRESLRGAISLEEAYTLLGFARRSAVFALRSPDESWAADGLAACAAVELERVDGRDVLVALALLHHAASRSGEEAERLLEDAGRIGHPELRTLVRGFLDRPAAGRDLRDAWGWVEVEAPGGTGLLPWGFRPWMPTVDLASVAVAIAEMVSADMYRADSPNLATEMPEVWLADAADPGLGSMLGAARGTVTIHGRLRPEASPDHAGQQLTIFLLETSDARAAKRLAQMASAGRPETALLGVSAGSLFTLVVARSWVEGVEAFETTGSLARFEEPLRAVMERSGSA